VHVSYVRCDAVVLWGLFAHIFTCLNQNWAKIVPPLQTIQKCLDKWQWITLRACNKLEQYICGLQSHITLKYEVKYSVINQSTGSATNTPPPLRWIHRVIIVYHVMNYVLLHAFRWFIEIYQWFKTGNFTVWNRKACNKT
jgi:hypothetical protein